MGSLAPVRAIGRREGPGLSPEEQQAIARLARRDRAVRAYERAHVLIGGSLVQAYPTYTYQRGPDGDYYAIGGEMTLGLAADSVHRDFATDIQAMRAATSAPADLPTLNGGALMDIARALEKPAGAESSGEFGRAVAKFYGAVAAGAGRRPTIDVIA